jgi:hypothetical protein
LLRRVSLDLIGLPPTLEEQEQFLADESALAYAKVVDRLLARPEYGERWARHWLDVVRYAETNGYERDNDKPSVWRYRDYVIHSLNADKPYDRFITEQLAGDEIEGSNAETQIATTYLRLGPWDDEPADPLVDRYDQLDDIVGNTSASLIALTIRCARCHDHKFEPFTQRDYTRWLANFEPLKRPQTGRDDLDRAVGTDAELAAVQQREQAIEMAAAELQDFESGVVRQAQAENRLGTAGNLPADVITALAIAPKERNDAQRKLIKDQMKPVEDFLTTTASGDDAFRLHQLREKLQQLTEKHQPAPRAYVFFEEGPECGPAHVLKRGDPRSQGDEVGPGFPAVLVDAPPAPPAPTAKSTGRRLQLARWLTSPDHPLTARVIVNRLWQHHFGEGLVATENDFGIMGAAPSNQELLDWLSSELVAGGWKLKPMHRLMVLSRTYQMAAVATDRADKIDPENALLSYWRPRRLEAEAVRDCILAVAGTLNPAKGGPSIYPKLSEAVLATQSRPGSGWRTSSVQEAARRSIYICVKRTLLVPELEVLDLPSSETSCEQRIVSTVAPQALTFLNGEFTVEQSKAFADRLMREAGRDRAAQIKRAFALALCREPKPEEQSLAEQFLVQQQSLIESELRTASQPTEDAAWRALSAFCQVLLNSNEFVYQQ